MNPDNFQSYPSPRDTAFDQLMLKRIRGVLIICSNYDAYLLEEDGRIDEQIYNECVSLSMSSVPVFYHADSEDEAFGYLKEKQIDLVIEMLNIRGSDSFKLSHRIKESYPGLPVVILTNFSREVSIKLQKVDLSAIDYVFCWLGNADILVAIYKLIEDSMNVESDVEVGVQTILLVEDSIRYTSIYLPFLYKMIITQTVESVKEGLNEHQKQMRTRGRPKLLLARTYDEAVALYDKYKTSMLGIISDVRYRKNASATEKMDGGIELCKLVKAEFPEMPIILQSSNSKFKDIAPLYGVAFVDKLDHNLLPKLRLNIIRDFCFGSFIFRDPETGKQLAQADDLFSLENVLATIPDESLSYHVSHHMISKWLNARGLFSLGKLFRAKTREDFESTSGIREYLLKGIERYRSSIGQGIIAQYDPDRFDKRTRFSRIGSSSIGGKARGLAFADMLIKKYDLNGKYSGISLHIPLTVAICADLFDEFMKDNKLGHIAFSEASDQEILDAFLAAELPERLKIDLRNIASTMTHPVAIRSSSKLEDSYYEPFAGIYSTYMIPCYKDVQKNFTALSDGIKAVYASVYYKNSKAYMRSTSSSLDEEKMGVVLQEICGRQHDNLYYPTISGVGKSFNFYPVGDEKPSEGVAYLAFGLGRYIVDGGSCLRFSPAHPKKALPFVDTKMAVRDSQKYFFALDTTEEFRPHVDEGESLKKLSVREASSHDGLKFISSTWDYQSQTLREGTYSEGRQIITFSNILRRESIPLANVIKDLLEIGAKEFGNPVEIEFAVEINPKDRRAVFHFLQIRPVLHTEQNESPNLEDADASDALILSRKTMGNGTISGISDIVYVKPENFSIMDTHTIAGEIGEINKQFIDNGKNYILVGPGRWGSSDDTLGIPVQWSQINGARVIIETDHDSIHTESSQGTHFFQNLTAFNIGYFCVSESHGEICRMDTISGQSSVTETEHVRHVHFDNPLLIQIDGEHGIGLISRKG